MVVRLLVALGLVARGGWLAGVKVTEREREKLKVKARKTKRVNSKKSKWLCGQALVTNLVFYKYKISPNLCLENTKSIFQIYFNWETFSKITLKNALFYKNGL